MFKFKNIVVKVFQESELEAEQFRNSSLSKQFDFKVLIICITTALSLTLIKYWNSYNSTVDFISYFINSQWAININNAFNSVQYSQLLILSHWVLVRAICYLLLPILIVKFIFKDSLKNYGLSFQHAFKDYKIYLFMLAFMIPIIFTISYSSSFQAKYPFYKLASDEPISIKLILWEIEYCFQFFTLEFFFRGFMLHGLKHRFGYYSVLVMTIPYCMIHFTKPMPEAIGAIVAGIVLGTFSLKSKNILLGFFIHCSVAITMDICALWQKGLLNF